MVRRGIKVSVGEPNTPKVVLGPSKSSTTISSSLSASPWSTGACKGLKSALTLFTTCTVDIALDKDDVDKAMAGSISQRLLSCPNFRQRLHFLLPAETVSIVAALTEIRSQQLNNYQYNKIKNIISILYIQ